MSKDEFIELIKENERLRTAFKQKMEWSLNYRLQRESELYELIDKRISIVQTAKDSFDANDGEELIVRVFKPDRVNDKGELIIAEWNGIPSTVMPRILRG